MTPNCNRANRNLESGGVSERSPSCPHRNDGVRRSTAHRGVRARRAPGARLAPRTSVDDAQSDAGQQSRLGCRCVRCLTLTAPQPWPSWRASSIPPVALQWHPGSLGGHLPDACCSSAPQQNQSPRLGSHCRASAAGMALVHRQSRTPAAVRRKEISTLSDRLVDACVEPQVSRDVGQCRLGPMRNDVVGHDLRAVQ